LRLDSFSPFVGRASELGVLHGLVPRRDGDGRRIALIGGEAGSGKSRLVREFARAEAAGGVTVLYGACDAVVRTPYRPFVEALELLVRATDTDTLRRDLGPAGGELARLLPELRVRVPDLPEPVAADADTERHRLHSVVCDLLAGATERSPLLLVLEDGHWADASTLLLLRHLARAASVPRLLVVATFRDTEVDVPVDLAETLADLRRADEVVRLKLDGLNEDEIVEFVVRAAGGADDAALRSLAVAIHALTEGNPFLVCELWRALLETGALSVEGGTVRLTRPLEEIATPQSVREVVSQRVARLDPHSRDLLELAAVAGQVFDLDLLQRASHGSAGPAGALDAAVRSGMVEEVPARSLAYRFTHELVRRALYDRLSALRRAELHLEVAKAIELAEGSASRLADLAYHYAAASPLGARTKAIEYSLLAAEAAARALAFEEQASSLCTALEIGIDDAPRRAAAQLELGAAYFRGGMSLESLAAFRAAAEIARELADAELFAEAAIGFENSCWRPGISDAGALELLEEAVGMLPAGDSLLLVRVLAGLTRALDFQGAHGRGATVRAEAVEMARRFGDREGLATTLMRAYWSRGETSLEEIGAMLAEARDLAVELGDLELQTEAMQWHVAALMALGEIDAAVEELAVVHELASRMRQPFLVHVAEHYASALALLQGRLADAEAAAERSRQSGQLLLGRDASGIYGIQMFGIRREQGRLGEFAPIVRLLVSGDGGAGGIWRPGLAVLLAELGMGEEARRELARVRVDGLDMFRETLWLGSLSYLADAARAVGDVETAALVYPELLPLAGGAVTIGHGVALYGAADRYLGMLAATLGELEEADARFRSAAALEAWMGASTWRAHTAFEHGRLLADMGETGAAAPLLAEAASIAETVGMPVLLARIRAVGSPPSRSAPFPDELSAREVEVLAMIASGLSNREIGRGLHISEHTAANHVRNILRKTGCSNRTEAAAYAIRRGLAPGGRGT
jgi:DNA-binding CsgD family transcriptional regulator/tetratricopeptide (TPR) repeat protein